MKLLTSEDFASWFASLDQRTAEDVAATLEVIEQLGTEKEAPGSSEWLTWYEHPSLSARLRDRHPHEGADPRFVQTIHEWGAFNGYARRVVKHLESRGFVERLDRARNHSRCGPGHLAVLRSNHPISRCPRLARLPEQ